MGDVSDEALAGRLAGALASPSEPWPIALRLLASATGADVMVALAHPAPGKTRLVACIGPVATLVADARNQGDLVRALSQVGMRDVWTCVHRHGIIAAATRRAGGFIPEDKAALESVV